jgi:hypothetical protein
MDVALEEVAGDEEEDESVVGVHLAMDVNEETPDKPAQTQA